MLDLTNVLAGPFCCHQLAHLGAEVVKVEARQHGDLARQLGGDPALNRAHMGVSFLAQNAGKRSIALDLKHAQGREILLRLVRSADVLVENFRPGVMQRLSLGHETLRAEHPDLVYCAISGFGQDGPLASMPAYDQIVQGMAGVMSITGDAKSAPLRVGYPVCDTIGGMTAAFALAAALAAPEGRRGCFIDVSMLESTLAAMGWVVSNHLVTGRVPEPMGNDNFTASPSGTFATGDGLLNIATNRQEQFESLCRVLELDALALDARFALREARLEHRAALTRELEVALARKPAREWLPLLVAAGIPSGLVVGVPEALAHPQVATRGMIAHFPDVPGVGRDLKLVRTGIKVDGRAPSVDAPPPRLGEHGDAILAELGYDAAAIDRFKEQGVT